MTDLHLRINRMIIRQHDGEMSERDRLRRGLKYVMGKIDDLETMRVILRTSLRKLEKELDERVVSTNPNSEE